MIQRNPRYAKRICADGRGWKTSIHPSKGIVVNKRTKEEGFAHHFTYKEKEMLMVADGSRQRVYMNKDDVTSPTVQLESLLMTWTIDALEGRNIATADVGGAFLLPDIVDFVLVKIDGEVVDIMCEANPSYMQYVTCEYNKKVLYMKLRKSLYGIMEAAILWYDTFSGCLNK